MKHVVIVGSDFAPSSYPPALRLRFFATHLPEFGYRPTVVTTQPRFYQWPVDEENLKLVPPGLRVIRTAAVPEHLTRRIGFGDTGIRSMGRHWRAISRLCRTERVDLLFFPVPPNVPMILGRLAHARFGVPYVIDYIDPWVTNFYFSVPKEQRPNRWWLSYGMGKLFEPFAVRRVSHLTTVARPYVDGVLERSPWLAPEDVTAIPYGGEPADFAYLRAHPRRNAFFDRNDGLRHFCYVGRGGADMISTLRALFQAVNLGLKREPELFAKLRFHFVGTSYASGGQTFQVLPTAREEGLDGIVNEHPARVAYLDALQILLDAHGLMAIGSEAAYYTASKIFPNVLANRPLLAIFHEQSSVVNIMRETGAGEPVTFNESGPGARVEEIFERLRAMLQLPPDSRPPTNFGAFEPYTTRAMTRELAHAFDRVLGRSTPATRIDNLS